MTDSQANKKPVQASADKAARIAAIAPRCPTPTSDATAGKIATYLEAATEDPGLDALATEWNRLDDASRICRTGKK